jgi:hypothetical protein
MLRLLADENFTGALVTGLLRRQRDLDLVRVQDVGLSGVDDPTLLEWAAHHQRVLLTHDAKTITKYANERVAAGKRMPGVFEVPRPFSAGRIIEEILILALCSLDGEWEGQVRYLPLS